MSRIEQSVPGYITYVNPEDTLDALLLAKMITDVALEAIAAGTIPEGDLPLSKDEKLKDIRRTSEVNIANIRIQEDGLFSFEELTERFDELVEEGTRKILVAKRYTKILERLEPPDDPKKPIRHTLVIKDPTKELSEQIIGTGSLGISPEHQRAGLSSFYVRKSDRNSEVILTLMATAFEVIRKYEQRSGVEIKTIEVGRFDSSEEKKAIFSRLMNMVNKVKPNTVSTVDFDWNGDPGKFYIFPKDVAYELFEEVGVKLARFF